VLGYTLLECFFPARCVSLNNGVKIKQIIEIKKFILPKNKFIFLKKSYAVSIILLNFTSLLWKDNGTLAPANGRYTPTRPIN